MSADIDLAEAIAIELFAARDRDGLDGTYFVGDLPPAPPAVETTDALEPP